MLLHANHSVHHGHIKFLIWTEDTYVAVLAVYMAQILGPEYELWIAFATGKYLHYYISP